MPYPYGADRRPRSPQVPRAPRAPRAIAIAVARPARRVGELPRAMGLVLALGCAVEFALALAAALAG